MKILHADGSGCLVALLVGGWIWCDLWLLSAGQRPLCSWLLVHPEWFWPAGVLFLIPPACDAVRRFRQRRAPGP